MRVLAIGGLEPSGRAGLLADVETIHALGAHARAVATSITAQRKRPLAIAVAPALVREQLEAAGPVDAIKIGVIPNRAILKIVARHVARLKVPTVVDPVIRSSKGLRLSTLRYGDFAVLSRPFVVVTPNQSERVAMYAFQKAVVKSEGPGRDVVYVKGKRPVSLSGSVLARSQNHRGTGCRFASALAVGLAAGDSLTDATKRAKRLVRKFLATPILSEF